MNNALSMSTEFEKQKNLTALAYTAGIAAAILMLIIFIKWSIPTKKEPVVEEYVEINLGSDLDGFGQDQPQLPGMGAPEQTAYTPTQPVAATEESVRDVADENEKSNEAPPVIKPVTSRPDATRINAETKTVKTPAAPVTQPAVVQAPKPKTVMNGPRGSNGSGGNGADSYVKGGSEGDGSGTGDKGVNGGNPNGTRYTGTPKSFGIRMMPIGNQTFEDDFNQNAKIAMIVEVNASGKVISATHTSKGSTGTATKSMIDIARRRAFEIKFAAFEGGQKGTLVFDFKVR